MPFRECLILSIFSSRGKNKERAFQAEKATWETPRNTKEHVCGIHSSLLRKNRQEKP